MEGSLTQEKNNGVETVSRNSIILFENTMEFTT